MLLVMKPCNLFAVAVRIGILFSLTSCGPSKPARDAARGGVLVMVSAIDAADAACAATVLSAKGSKDEAKLTAAIKLGETCAKTKVDALAWARVASVTIDAWGNADAEKSIGCAAVRILGDLSLVRDAVIAAGGKIPALVEDGIAQAAVIGRVAGAACPAVAAAMPSVVPSTSASVAPATSASP